RLDRQPGSGMDVQGADMDSSAELLFQSRGCEGGEILVINPDPARTEKGENKDGEGQDGNQEPARQETVFQGVFSEAGQYREVSRKETPGKILHERLSVAADIGENIFGRRRNGEKWSFLIPKKDAALLEEGQELLGRMKEAGFALALVVAGNEQNFRNGVQGRRMRGRNSFLWWNRG
ncbi:MAG: hypothetical protein ABF809_07255, partial [Gluconobacter potus]|uniref:hypothetical protein n=2 Tax=Gluconobacter TaxID=441 RepID=UPI0039E84035